MNDAKAGTDYSKLFILIIALATAAVISIMYHNGAFENLELRSLDLRYKINSITPRPPINPGFKPDNNHEYNILPGIVLIDLPDTGDGDDVELRRDLCSSIIKILAYSGAKTIVLNSIISKPLAGDQDLALAVVISESEVYMPVFYGVDKSFMDKFYMGLGVVTEKKPLSLFRGKNVGAGHINAFADADDRLRRVPAIIRYGGNSTYHFGLKIAFDAMGISKELIEFNPEKHCIIFPWTYSGHTAIQLDKDNRLILNWGSINEKDVKRFSSENLIEAYRLVLYGVRPSMDLSVFKDKICIIGPVNSGTTGLAPSFIKHDYSNAVSCAVIISNIFRGDFVREIPQPLNIAIVFFVSFMFGASLANRHVLTMTMIFLFGAMFLVAISVYGLPKNANLLLIFLLIALAGIIISRFQVFSGMLFTAFSVLLYLAVSAGLFRLFNLSVVTFYPVISIVAIFILYYIYIKVMGYVSRQRLIKSATRDGLTMLYNRRHFNLVMDAELNAASMNRMRKLSIVMCDIDDFKKLNDTYGHQAGDTVLKEVAGIIKANCRQSDVPARYGGEEFVIVFIGAGAKETMEIAERIRSLIASKKFIFNDQQYRATISMGLTQFSGEKTKESLIEKADQALYRAKKEGKNRICIN